LLKRPPALRWGRPNARRYAATATRRRQRRDNRGQHGFDQAIGHRARLGFRTSFGALLAQLVIHLHAFFRFGFGNRHEI
jgi:hypothetical protein